MLYQKNFQNIDARLKDKDAEIEKILKEKEECGRQMRMAQEREKLLSDRLGESDYLRKLMDKQLDVTYPEDMTRGDISLNQSNRLLEASAID